MLEDRRCTIHWEDFDAFREVHPELNVSNEIFEFDGRVFTCSGGSAATDMFLSFVALQFGVDLAMAIAAQLVHQPVRSGTARQCTFLSNTTGVTHPVLYAAIGCMEEHIAEPLPIGGLLQELAVSVRQLERLFRRHAGWTPQAYYRDLRLRHAEG